MDTTDKLVITEKNRAWIRGYVGAAIERGVDPDEAVRRGLVAWEREQQAYQRADDAIRRAECAEGMP